MNLITGSGGNYSWKRSCCSSFKGTGPYFNKWIYLYKNNNNKKNNFDLLLSMKSAHMNATSNTDHNSPPVYPNFRMFGADMTLIFSYKTKTIIILITFKGFEQSVVIRVYKMVSALSHC